MALLEGLVLAWGAQHFYQVWTRLYSFFVAIRLPWQAGNAAKVDDAAPVEAPPKRIRHRQAAIDARNDYIKLFAVVTK